MLDCMLFIMPRDRELQFPAMAILQAFVNCYSRKMADPFTNPAKIPFELQWDVDMPDEDWQVFQRLGIELETQRTRRMGVYDCLIDLSDSRLQQERWPDRHVCQAMGFLSGVEALPLPKIKRILPKVLDGYRWCVTSPDMLPYVAPLDVIQEEDLLRAEQHSITGVIGIASPLTYLAVSMGLAVVEILPDGRKRNWMSKFTSAGYRMLATQDRTLWADYIRRATRSVEMELEFHVAQERERMRREDAKRKAQGGIQVAPRPSEPVLEAPMAGKGQSTGAL